MRQLFMSSMGTLVLMGMVTACANEAGESAEGGEITVSEPFSSISFDVSPDTLSEYCEGDAVVDEQSAKWGCIEAGSFTALEADEICRDVYRRQCDSGNVGPWVCEYDGEFEEKTCFRKPPPACEDLSRIRGTHRSDFGLFCWVT